MSQGFLSDYQRRLDAALADASSVRTSRFVLVDVGGEPFALPASSFAAILPVLQPVVRYDVQHLACFCLHDGDEYVGLSLASLLKGGAVGVQAASRVLIPEQDGLDESLEGVAFVVDALKGFAADLPEGMALVDLMQLAQRIQRT